MYGDIFKALTDRSADSQVRSLPVGSLYVVRTSLVQWASFNSWVIVRG